MQRPIRYPPVSLLVYAKGPAGGAEVMYDVTQHDDIDKGTVSAHVNIPANTLTKVASFTAAEAAPGRFAGTIMLHSGQSLVQVDFDAQNVIGANGCTLFGTATNGT